MHQSTINSGHTIVAPDGEIEGVRLTTLDDFCAGIGLDRLDVLIVDVEGFEERALRGARETLRRFRPLVYFELFPPVMEVQGSGAAAATDILRGLGYELFRVRKDRLEPLTAVPVDNINVNVFGFHREKLPAP